MEMTSERVGHLGYNSRAGTFDGYLPDGSGSMLRVGEITYMRAERAAIETLLAQRLGQEWGQLSGEQRDFKVSRMREASPRSPEMERIEAGLRQVEVWQYGATGVWIVPVEKTPGLTLSLELTQEGGADAFLPSVYELFGGAAKRIDHQGRSVRIFLYGDLSPEQFDFLSASCHEGVVSRCRVAMVGSLI